MTSHLVLTLAAPLASFGAVAVGERRPTWDRPSKSQTLGLVAGALGIERSDESGQARLAACVGYAVRIDDPGSLASDYHTAQSPKEPAIRRRAKTHGPIRTRADELACDNLKTILSRREFRTGSHYTIALWQTGDGIPALAEIAVRLTAPAFAPYAGRKAFPLMLPMSPRLVEAEDAEGAFAAYDAALPAAIAALADRLGLRSRPHRPVFTERGSLPLERISRIEERRDAPESRAKWRFALRTEVMLRPGAGRGDAS